MMSPFSRFLPAYTPPRGPPNLRPRPSSEGSCEGQRNGYFSLVFLLENESIPAEEKLFEVNHDENKSQAPVRVSASHRPSPRTADDASKCLDEFAGKDSGIRESQRVHRGRGEQGRFVQFDRGQGVSLFVCFVFFVFVTCCCCFDLEWTFLCCGQGVSLFVLFVFVTWCCCFGLQWTFSSCLF